MNLLRATRKAILALLGRGSVQHDEPALDELQTVLSYRFKDITLLKQAVTHKSSINPDRDADWLLSNERLEFLGDAVLSCLITDYLYTEYPDKSEGQLSKIKSLVVSRKILGDVAYAMKLGAYLILGPSEAKTGGRERKSVLSNTFEAVLGALYLDGGLEISREFLHERLFSRIDEFISDKGNTNYKSRLLELSQHDGFGIPRYAVIATSGPDHARQFRIRVDVAGVPLGEGMGPNKKIAQQEAAYRATLEYEKEKIASQSKGAHKDELVSH